MAIEIERKFLLKSADWRQLVVSSDLIQQGYLSTVPEKTVRVRSRGEKAFLTIKGKNEGLSRLEFEYEIPASDAQDLLKLCDQSISKTRHLVHQGDLVWEIDEFHDLNRGLILAEIELKSESQEFPLPCWIGEEVSNDARYYNSNLTTHPFSVWNC
ncbi:MAG: CYTH domain-containing protein [Flavobacteriales bacterium]